MRKRYIILILLLSLVFVLPSCKKEENNEEHVFFKEPNLGEKLDNYTINRKAFSVNSNQLEVLEEIVKSFEFNDCYEYKFRSLSEQYTADGLYLYQSNLNNNIYVNFDRKIYLETIKYQNRTFDYYYMDQRFEFMRLINEDNQFFEGYYYKQPANNEDSSTTTRYGVGPKYFEDTPMLFSDSKMPTTFLNLKEWFHAMISSPGFTFQITVYENYIVLEIGYAKMYLNRKTMKLEYEYQLRTDFEYESDYYETYCVISDKNDYIYEEHQKYYQKVLNEKDNWNM